MKKKLESPKLILSKQIVATLDARDLVDVQGGKWKETRLACTTTLC